MFSQKKQQQQQYIVESVQQATVLHIDRKE